MRHAFLASCILVSACSGEPAPSIISPTTVTSTSSETAAANSVGTEATGSLATASAHRDAPFLVIENVHFIGLGGGPGCAAIEADITNYGNAVQPFGWTWTVTIPKLHVSNTFVGQQPLAPGETRLLLHNPGVTEPGTYRVQLTAESADGRTQGAGATLRIPC